MNALQQQQVFFPVDLPSGCFEPEGVQPSGWIVLHLIKQVIVGLPSLAMGVDDTSPALPTPLKRCY